MRRQHLLAFPSQGIGFAPAQLLLVDGSFAGIIFVWPILLPLQLGDRFSTTGLAVYLLGTAVYFVSWATLIWMPDAAWGQSTLSLLAPRLTPLLLFLGIALIGRPVPYALVSALFILLHTWHGMQNLSVV